MNKVSKKISLITIILIFIFSCSLFLAPMKIVKAECTSKNPFANTCFNSTDLRIKAAAAIFEAGCQGKYGSRK